MTTNLLCASYVNRIVKDFDDYVSTSYASEETKREVEAYIMFELKLLRNALIAADDGEETK